MITFIKQTFRNFHHTGAVAPSSRFVAKALIAPLHGRNHAPIHILEAGPGTGALTGEILECLKPGDHLTLCEING
ncbi:MAG: hypothetical protein K1X53_08480, partial [Candidatus Sumerlaeaceae bacterium]|nr:hypothetical protein [Candidatus Sumerlaeaceae bacterium]